MANVNLQRLPHQLDEAASTCRAVIETPAGSRHKYAYDPAQEAFVLRSILAEGLVLPLAFGFIPCTCAADGDPLDVMVWFDDVAPVGMLGYVRVIGAIEGEETAKTIRNDRLLADAQVSSRASDLRSVKDVPRTMLEQPDAFWRVRNEVRGKDYRVLRHVDAAAGADPKSGACELTLKARLGG